MKVNMDDLLLAGLLDNNDELILLSQVCSGSDVPSFEKGFDLDTYTEEQSKASFRFYKDGIRNLCVELGIRREFRAGGPWFEPHQRHILSKKTDSFPNHWLTTQEAVAPSQHD